MQGTLGNHVIAAACLVALSACSAGRHQPTSLLDVSTGPDASQVALGQDLQVPGDLTSLPTPDVSADNLAGSGPVLVAATSGDAALLAHASQFSTTTVPAQQGGFFSRLWSRLF